MKDDKKKLIAIIALVAVIAGVGVFQFVLAPSSAAPASTAAKKEDKSVANPIDQAPPAKNPLLVANLPARDPFTMPTLPGEDPQKIVPPVPPKPDYSAREPVLPPAGIDKSGGFAPVHVENPPEAQFGFNLAGVMLGEKPMAVFADGQGNQRLIMLGGSLDAESKVISIDKDAVTVRFHGKNLRLTVEGKPNAK